MYSSIELDRHGSKNFSHGYGNEVIPKLNYIFPGGSTTYQAHYSENAKKFPDYLKQSGISYKNLYN